MKKCIQCKIEKDISEFYKDMRIKGGYRNKCKNCTNLNNKKWVEKNPEKKKISNKKWVEKNPEYMISYQKINGEEIYEKRKDYFKNWVFVNRYSKKYYHMTKDSRKEKKEEYNKIWMEKNPNYYKDYNRKYKIEKRKDVLYQLSESISNSIRHSIKRKGYIKKSRSLEILGCSIEEFKIYLESKFEPWMNWNNRGLYNGELNYGWDIDHIIPISLAKSEDEILKLNHYTNLQPLCSYTNRHIKSDHLLN